MTARVWLMSAWALAAFGPSALAQTSTRLPPPDPASLQDSRSIWTIQDENASFTTRSLSDRYNTNALRLNYTSSTDGVPDFLSNAGLDIWGDGVQRISLELSQSIFTPRDTQSHTRVLGDRPYAGILRATAALLHDTASARSVIAVSVGVIGPPAGGEEIQNGFHDLIGQGHNQGWNNQLHTEPVFQATAERTWRVPVTQFSSLEVDALPNVTVGVGTERVYGLAGASFRLGQGLASDFGVARVRPGLSGSDAFQPVRPFAWYVFVGADGQGVAHDITLNGNVFRTSQHVNPVPYVGELEVGLAFIWHGTRLSYTQVFQTVEFHGQHGGLQQFGSLALSARF